MTVKITPAEHRLLKEVRELRFGELVDVFLPAEEPTVRADLLHRTELALIRTLREYQEVAEIKVQDGLPMFVLIPQRGEFGKKLKRIKL